MLEHVICFSAKTFGFYNPLTLFSVPDTLKLISDINPTSIVVQGPTWDETSLDIKTCMTRSFQYRLFIDVAPPDQSDINGSQDHLGKSKIVFIGNESLDHIPVIHAFVIQGVPMKYENANKEQAENETHSRNRICNILQGYEIASVSDMMYSNEHTCDFRHITYRLQKYEKYTKHGEHVYLDTLRDIVQNGSTRPDRTGIGTHSVFARQMRFDISKHIPLMTTKFVPWKLVIKELLWFLKGHTDSKKLEEQGVNIWKGNTSREFLDKQGLYNYEQGDTGPMYGFNLRHFGAEYKGCDNDYTGQGYDQLQTLIHNLKTDPFSRRHMMTTFNPAITHQGVLAPCHGIVVQFYCDEMNDMYGKHVHLSCQMYQRSSDTFLGNPVNIASYAILTHMLAAMCDMIPKELILTTGDTHVYNNHIDQVDLQLQRQPFPFPILRISKGIKTKTIHQVCLDDFEVIGYLHHPAIKAPMAI